MNPKELMTAAFEKRNGAYTKMRELVERAQSEKREMDAEEKQQFDRLEEEHRAQDADYRRYESLAKIEEERQRSNGPRGGAEVGAPGKNEFGLRSFPNGSEEYRKNFEHFLRRGQKGGADVRGLEVGTGNLGGYLVPTGFETELLRYLEAENFMRGLATVQTLGYLENDIPIAEDYGAATWLGENEKYTETTDSFNQVKMKALKLGRITRVSEELLMDAYFNVETEVTRGLGISFARAEESAMIIGAGSASGQPEGVLTGTSKSVTSLASSAVAYEDIVNLRYAIRDVYARRAAWLIAPGAAKALVMLKDADGRPLWQPSLQLGQPDLLLGRPVYTSEYMPEFKTGETPILFGDFSRYRIADRAGLFVQRLDELYAEYGQVGFRGRRRLDAKLLDKNALVKLVLS